MLGVRGVPRVGKLAGFETNFVIDRRNYGVLGNPRGAIPGVLTDEVNIHIVARRDSPRTMMPYKKTLPRCHGRVREKERR